jgi:hypothetical protein
MLTITNMALVLDAEVMRERKAVKQITALWTNFKSAIVADLKCLKESTSHTLFPEFLFISTDYFERQIFHIYCTKRNSCRRVQEGLRWHSSSQLVIFRTWVIIINTTISSRSTILESWQSLSNDEILYPSLCNTVFISVFTTVRYSTLFELQVTCVILQYRRISRARFYFKPHTEGPHSAFALVVLIPYIPAIINTWNQSDSIAIWGQQCNGIWICNSE